MRWPAPFCFATRAAPIATVKAVSGAKRARRLSIFEKDKQWTPEKITNQILNGGQKMPPFADSLTDAEVAQIIAYLRDKHRPVVPPALPPA